MSNRNGDKSRHHRQRKQAIRRRAAFSALAVAPAPAKKAKPAKPGKAASAKSLKK